MSILTPVAHLFFVFLSLCLLFRLIPAEEVIENYYFFSKKPSEKHNFKRVAGHRVFPLEEQLIFVSGSENELTFKFNNERSLQQTLYKGTAKELGVGRRPHGAAVKKIDLWKNARTGKMITENNGKKALHKKREFVKSYVRKQFHKDDRDLAQFELQRLKRAGREYAPSENAVIHTQYINTPYNREPNYYVGEEQKLTVDHVFFNMPFIPGVSVRNFGFEVELKRKLLNYAKKGRKRMENNTLCTSTSNLPNIRKIANTYKSIISKKIKHQVNFLHNELNMAHGDLHMANVMIVMDEVQKEYLKKCEDVEKILEILEMLDFRLIDFGSDRNTLEKCMADDEGELASLKRRDIERMGVEIEKVVRSPMQAEWV